MKSGLVLEGGAHARLPPSVSGRLSGPGGEHPDHGRDGVAGCRGERAGRDGADPDRTQSERQGDAIRGVCAGFGVRRPRGGGPRLRDFALRSVFGSSVGRDSLRREIEGCRVERDAPYYRIRPLGVGFTASELLAASPLSRPARPFGLSPRFARPSLRSAGMS